MGLRLIVHADDLGISEEVNQGIRLAHLNGVLTSTSIMPTGRAFASAVALVSSLPTLDTGIHLTLVGERPLLPANDIPTLVDERGHFHAHATVFVRRFLLGKVDMHQVHAELDAQVQKAMESGLDITHVDTHQHLHALPAVLSIAKSIAKKYGINCIRRPAERMQGYMLREPGALTRLLQMLVLNQFCRAGDWQEIQHPDHFSGFFFGGRLSVTNLRILIGALPTQGSCELMCHPGTAAQSKDYEDWQYAWTEELDALVNDQIQQLLKEKDIRLISYRDL